MKAMKSVSVQPVSAKPAPAIGAFPLNQAQLDARAAHEKLGRQAADEFVSEQENRRARKIVKDGDDSIRVHAWGAGFVTAVCAIATYVVSIAVFKDGLSATLLWLPVLAFLIAGYAHIHARNAVEKAYGKLSHEAVDENADVIEYARESQAWEDTVISVHGSTGRMWAEQLIDLATIMLIAVGVTGAWWGWALALVLLVVGTQVRVHAEDPGMDGRGKHWNKTFWHLTLDQAIYLFVGMAICGMMLL